MSAVFGNQDNEFDNFQLTILDSITVNRNPILYVKVWEKKYVDRKLVESIILRPNQTLQNHFKVFVGKTVYNNTKYDWKQIIDSTNNKTGNTGAYLLPFWKTECNDKNIAGIISNFRRTTKTNSLTGNTGATTLPPIGDSFMYIERIGKSVRSNAFVSFDRT